MGSINGQMSGWQKFKKNNLTKMLAPLALIIIYIFFGIFGRNFFSYDTFVNILDSSYYIGFAAIGVTFVIITGGIDLSCGTVMMAAAIIGGTAYKSWGWPMWLALASIVIIGTAFGFFNGLMISRLKLPPFIATLGTMMISMGIGSIVSNVRSATFPNRSQADGWFKNIFKYFIEDTRIQERMVDGQLQQIEVISRIPIPTGAIVLIGVAFIAFILLTKTKMGRYIFAIGSNKEAARLSGVDVKKWEMMAYVISGLLAGIGGVAFATVYTTVMPAQGQGFELDAIAGAVIGGTSLSGGIGSIFGTLIGVYIMSVLKTGLPSMDLQAHYQTFFTGVVVIGAVLLDIYRNNKASEVKVQTPADIYKTSVLEKIAELKFSGKGNTEAKIKKLKAEMKITYKKMKADEEMTKRQLEAEEKASEREFHQQFKKEQTHE